MAKSRQKRHDWDAIERDYRTGTLSNRELERKYAPNGPSEAAIRYQAKKQGWEKDLQPKVKAKIKNDLLKGNLPPTASEKEIVDEAARQGVEIVEFHRKDIATARVLIAGLFEELNEQKSLDKAALKRLAEKLPKEDHHILITAIHSASFGSRCKNLGSLVKSLANVVPLERQAFGLNADGDGDESYEDLIRDLENRSDLADDD